MGLDVDQVKAILDALVRGTRDIEGAGLVTPDGLPLVSVLPDGMDEDQVAAMSAVMLTLGERIGEELRRGTVERIAVDGG
ncbi:MAG: roadblock/LC7 domain-containing protein [Cyanobacteria bacterium J06632_22]